jgi:hypothetical protein
MLGGEGTLRDYVEGDRRPRGRSLASRREMRCPAFGGLEILPIPVSRGTPGPPCAAGRARSSPRRVA